MIYIYLDIRMMNVVVIVGVPASQPASRGAKSFQNCLFLNQNILALGLLTPTVSREIFEPSASSLNLNEWVYTVQIQSLSELISFSRRQLL